MTKVTCFFLLLGVSAFAQQRKDLLGYWKSCDDDNNMVVEIKLNAKNIPIGYLVGFQKEDDTWEKEKPPKGIKVMYNFKYQGNLQWNKGKIYDPKTKRTYKGTVKLVSKDTIKATGYWAFLRDDILFKRIQLDKKTRVEK